MIYKMQIHAVAIVSIGLLALAGCSSTPTKVDSGQIKAATFNFVGNGAMAAADFAENRQPVHALIQEAIGNNLARKGVSRTTGAGDVTVAYLIIVGNNVSTTSINDYFGYGRDASALVNKAHNASAIKNQNPNFYEAGSLVIDLIDSRSHELLWRSYVVRPILRNPPADVQKSRIQEAVDEALKSLRIAR